MGCLFRHRTGIYYGIFCHRGKRVWRSTFTRDAEEAKKVFELLQREYVTWKRLTLTGFRQEIMPLIRDRLAPSSIELYSQALRTFIETIGDRPLRSVTPYHIELYMAKRLREVSPTKVNIDFRSLKALFNRAVQCRMIESNPVMSCKPVRVPERRPCFLSRNDLESLLAVIDNPTMEAIVIVAVCTAMRLGEVVHLKWQSVDLGRGVIMLENQPLFNLKNRRSRVIPMNQKVRRVLMSLPRQSDSVFVNHAGREYLPGFVSSKFKEYVRKAGLPEEIHFHSLRHTGATWLVQQNVPLAFVKEILGHSSITTTMIYAHSPIDHLQESVLRIDSLFEN